MGRRIGAGAWKGLIAQPSRGGGGGGGNCEQIKEKRNKQVGGVNCCGVVTFPTAG